MLRQRSRVSATASATLGGFGAAAPGAGGANGDEVIVAYANEPPNRPTDICVQRFDRAGNAVWGGGAALKVGASDFREFIAPVLCEDGAGGAYVAYRCMLPAEKGRPREEGAAIVRLDGAGRLAWHAGATLVRLNGSPRRLALIPAGRSGVIAIGCRPTSWSECLAMRIDQDGRPHWLRDGEPLAVGSDLTDQTPYACVSDGQDGAIVLYVREDSRQNRWLEGQRVSRDGVLLWSGGKVLVEPTAQQYRVATVAAVPDGSGGVIGFVRIHTWDHGTRREEIWAQRLDGAGSRLWGATGVRVADVRCQDHSRPAVLGAGVGMGAAGDGFGGAAIAFEREWDHPQDETDTTVLVQRLDSRGNAAWAAGGVPAVGAERSRRADHPAIACDGSRGVIVACDIREASGAYGVAIERLSEAGKARWDVGKQIADVRRSYTQEAHPAIAASSDGGAFVVCVTDAINSGAYGDLGVRRLLPTGQIAWPKPQLSDAGTGPGGLLVRLGPTRANNEHPSLIVVGPSANREPAAGGGEPHRAR